VLDSYRAALSQRGDLLAKLGDDTTCVRLMHGAVEGAPGVAIDRYGPVLLVQTWRDPLADGVLDELHRATERELGLDLVPVWNHRAKGTKAYSDWHTPAELNAPQALEHGLRYDVRPRHRGRDPLLFLDFRSGRRRVREHSDGKRVLNLFAYTCGIGVAARAGGASSVLNVDFAVSAIAVGRHNAQLNQLLEGFDTLVEDCLPVMRLLADLPIRQRRGRQRHTPKVDPQTFDLVVLDPPRWATSKWGAVDIVRDYQSLFKPALLCTNPGGHMLVTNNVASADAGEWVEGLRRCAHKAGRPVRSIELIPPDSDFPSPDGRHPLKMAWIEA
jgi:23S rRNA (cytosine1962-C5)-methyltransferase